MSDTLEVDPDGLRGVIASMRTSAATIGARAGGLQTSSRRLVNDDWSGEASNAYRARQDSWDRSMDARHAELVSYVGLLTRIVDRYEAAETKVIGLCG